MENQNKNIKNTKISEIEECDEPLAQPGKIFLAEIHGSAQHFLKIKKLSKYIRFCKCCLLPSETPGVVVPYTCLDNKEDFGIGIHLYFVYIKFCIITTFIGLCLSSIPTMVFTKRYVKHLNEYCLNYFIHNNNKTNQNLNNDTNTDFNPNLFTKDNNCHKYVNHAFHTDSELATIETEWAINFDGGNVINYYKFFENKSGNPDIITEVLISYSLIYFLTSITLLIMNFFFIHYVNLISDKEDFETTSPRDFTLIIHGVKNPNKNTTKIQHLKNIINEISQDHFKIEIHHIIPCYNISKLYKLTKQVFQDKIKIYHAYNFKLQKNLHKQYVKRSKFFYPGYDRSYSYSVSSIDQNKKLNKDNNNTNNNQNNHLINNSETIKITNENNISWNDLNQNISNVFIHDSKLNYYSKFLCFIKATPLNEIEQRIAKNNKKIKEIEKDIEENPDKNCSGTYYIVFKYIRMKYKFYDFFPTHFITKIIAYIKYFFQNIIFSRCVSERTKRINYIKTEFGVYHPTEAYEVIWQNIGYSITRKTLYLIASIIATIFLIGISFGIVTTLNYIQHLLVETEGSHAFSEYLLSFIISIIISLINSLGRKLLKKITRQFEAIETKTDYYISLSVKITIFTFINTSIIPLLSNYIYSDLNKNDILLNNILMIFITNFTLNPLVFYLNPNLLVKLSKRARARAKLEGLPLEDSTYTQDELNRLFQNPSMSLCYKYSFYTNSLLTSFFYMSIMPLGIVFSLGGLIISYFLEIVHLGFYKRPEVLNSKLCKYFIHYFKFVVAAFCVGNYVFLRDLEKHYHIDWSLINLILFLVIACIPYHSIQFNLLGVKEGEITKGSYDEYELMFPTDYEKQNPLTKKAAMIKYLQKLREQNLIDKFQSEYLINSIQKESPIVNYYKTSKNVGNILNYYEFQNQFVKLKKKSKFIKEIKQRRREQSKYDLFIKQKARERRETLASINNFINLRNSSNRKNTGYSSKINKINNIENINSIPNQNAADTNRNTNTNIIEDYSNLGYKKNYKIKGLVEDNPKLRRRVSVQMRKTLFQSVKDQGLYSDTDEENDESSFKNSSSEEESKIKDNDSLFSPVTHSIED